MSDHKREKVIHVDNLVIHAKNVEIIQERHEPVQTERRNPWDFFWGGQSRNQENVVESTPLDQNE